MRDGWLRIGFCGHQPGVGETYISTGSLYLVLRGTPAAGPAAIRRVLVRPTAALDLSTRLERAGVPDRSRVGDVIIGWAQALTGVQEIKEVRKETSRSAAFGGSQQIK